MSIAAAALTPDLLWPRARATFARALAALGGIAAIATRQALTPDVRAQIVAWLAPLEHIVRKLLLADAAALHRSERERARRAPRVEIVRLHPIARRGRSKVGRLEARRGAAARAVDLTQPESWSAKFSLAPPRDPLAVPDSRAPRIRAPWGTPPPPPPTPARRTASPDDAPFRLARRLEAIRRVLENPRPHAERLARLLARAVRRRPEIVRRYLYAPARGNGCDRADPGLAVDAMLAAFEAPDVITDSS